MRIRATALGAFGIFSLCAAAQAPAQMLQYNNCDRVLSGSLRAAVSADFDRDGAPDLAVIDTAVPRVVVLFGRPDLLAAFDCKGGFREASETLSNPPQAIAAADIDRNNTVDLVVVGDSGVTILRNDGGGEFTADNTIAAGPQPRAVAVGDLDGNSTPDILVGNGFGNQVNILYGPAFDPTKRVTLDTGGPALAVAADDLDDDSFADILALTDSSILSVFLQTEGEPNRMRALSRLTLTSAPAAVVLGRFTLAPPGGSPVPDVIPDLAVLGLSSEVVAVYRGQLPDNENEPFAASNPIEIQNLGGSPAGLAAGLFGDDADLDLVVSGQVANGLNFFAADAAGGFSPRSSQCDRNASGCTALDGPRTVVAADFDGDGSDDLVSVNEGSSSLTVFLSKPNFPTPSPTLVNTFTPVPTGTPTATPTTTPTVTITATETPTATITPTATPTPTGPSPTPTTPAPQSWCCTDHGGAGCEPSTCSACVVEKDPPCGQLYDSRCVDIARGACAADCQCPDFTPTPTATPTFTRTHTPTRTLTPTRTPKPAATTPGGLPSRTPTPTASATFTLTPLGFTHTPTLTPTITNTPTLTPTLTRTPSQTPTKTSKCAGSIDPCVEGESCAISRDSRGGAIYMLLPAVLLWAVRRRRGDEA